MFYELTSDVWGKEEEEAIARVMRSKKFTMGPEVANFEKEFAKKMDSTYAVMVNSGSSANLIAIASLFHKKDNPLLPGDEVIVPAISWATTYYPLQQYGLKLKFIDVNIDTLNMDTSYLTEALTPKTRLVVGVNILGNPSNLDLIRLFCDKHGLYFLEDNCESMGAKLNGVYCGTWGDIGTFSTFFSHHISTMEGGIIVTDDKELYHLCLCLRAHGWTRNLPSDSTLFNKHPDDFYEGYRFILPGYNVRPLEFSGAIGTEQLKKLDFMLCQRRTNAELFTYLFKDDHRFRIQKENGSSSWFSFTIILNEKSAPKRERVLKRLRDREIDYRIITGGNFLRHDVIKYFNYDCVGEINNANLAHDYGFFVGNHPIDLRPQIERLHLALSCI